MCCNQIQSFDVSILWQAEPTSKHQLTFIANSNNNKWEGAGNNSYEFDTVCECVPSLRGTINVRIRVKLECVETVAGKSYINGTIQFTVGSMTLRSRLKSIILTCGEQATAEWDMVWLGPLGNATVSITGRYNV